MFVPATITAVPPLTEPEFGDMEVTVGTGAELLSRDQLATRRDAGTLQDKQHVVSRWAMLAVGGAVTVSVLDPAMKDIPTSRWFHVKRVRRRTQPR